MDQPISCLHCSDLILRSELFEHFEFCKSDSESKPRYDVSCGACGLKVPADMGSQMINHCFESDHQISLIRLSFADFIKKETKRYKAVIYNGVRSLRHNFESNEDLKVPESLCDKTNLNVEGVILKSKNDSCGQSKGANSTTLRKKRKISSSQKGHETKNSSDLNVTKETFSPIKTECKEEDSCGTTPEKFIKIESADSSPTNLSSMISDVKETEDTSEKCKKCEAVIEQHKTKGTLKNQLLKHALMHSGLKFLRCSECCQEFSTTNKYLSHQKDGCNGTCNRVKTDQKIQILRKHLSDCFPSRDFEHEVANSYLFGVLEDVPAEVEPISNSTKALPKNQCRICFKLKVDYIPKKQDILRHVMVHSGLKLFSCNSCSALISQLHQVHRHMKNGSKDCNQGYSTLATEKDVETLRRLLVEAFPEYDWDREIPPGTMKRGIQF